MARNRNRNRTTKPEPQVETPAPEAELEPQAEPTPADETPQAETADELKENRSVVPKRWREVYAKSTLKGTNDDRLAHQLDELTKTDGKADLVKIRAIGWLNGIDVDARWGARNAGMQRMNLGNVLRGRAKRGEPVILSAEVAQAAE